MTAGVLPASVSPPNAFRPLLRLALPIIGVNVGMMLMGVVDTVMVGRLSPQALAAVALGNLYGMAVLMFGLGILLSLDPVLSQAHGAGEDETVALGVQRGVVLAILLSVPLAAVMWFAEPFLRMVRQPADVVPLAGTYCRVLIPGVLPFLLFTVGRQTMQVLHRVQPVLWTILIANLVNIGLNYWLIFGGAGVPPLGVAGSAAATAVSRVVMIVLLVFLARRELGPMLRPDTAASAAGGAVRDDAAHRRADRAAGRDRDGGVLHRRAADGDVRHGAGGRPSDCAESRVADLHGADGRRHGGVGVDRAGGGAG
ncbi:MAG: polysaccharide biosynthesis C-terminal domain-containing protein [Gemmatimonadetes bacterium]|nr:polysaccharide biosynthesis C-terminal domain-containing protein [Gemmatimonadota bacterium]